MKYKRIILPLLISILISFTFNRANAQLSEKYPNYEELSFEDMSYGLFKPKNYDPNIAYPIVLYLHGFGDTESKELDWYLEPFQTKNPCFIISPKCYGDPFKGTGWVSSTGLTDGQKAIDILNLTMEKYNIDEDRLYIHGASMGGFGVYGVLATYPKKFAAAFSVCAGFPIKFTSQFLDIPLWIFHGTLDDVIPVHLSRNIYHEIKKSGGQLVRYTEYPSVKHDSWTNVGNEKTLKTWLFKQAKSKTAGNPEKPEGLTLEKTAISNILKWELPSDVSNPNNNIWYYIILRNNKVLAEVDGDINMFTDKVFLDHDYYKYKIIAVNYYFKKSEPSVMVPVEN